MDDSANILAFLDSYTLDNPDDMAMDIAKEFRQRRIERNITREEIAEKSKVALANVIRFEQKGLISLRNLISLAVALEYTAEIKNIFSQPKYSTMEELTQIKKNSGKKRAYKR